MNKEGNLKTKLNDTDTKKHHWKEIIPGDFGTSKSHSFVDGCKLMVKESGNVKSEDPLVCFLYLLMRNELACGKVENIMVDLEKTDNATQFEFCNGWLAEYAKNIAKRLRGFNRD